MKLLIASILIAGAACLCACSGPQQRPENFPEAAFNTWQEKFPEGRFESYMISTPGDGSMRTCMLSVEEGEGIRYLVMYEDGSIIEDRYVEELSSGELPAPIPQYIEGEYPAGEVHETILIVRNDTTEYLVSVEMPERQDERGYHYYDNLVFSVDGEVKKRTNVVTTEEGSRAWDEAVPWK